MFTDTENFSGFQGHGFANPVFWFVFGLGLLMAQYTITGYDASAHMSEETRNASRSAAIGMVMSVVVSVIFGFILLVAVTFAIPGPVANTALQYDVRRAVHLAERDEHQVGGVPARDRLRGPVLLRPRIGDVGVADDVRVLARPGHPGTPAVAQGVRQGARARELDLGDLRPGVGADAADAEEPDRRLRGGDVDRGDRALHRVRAARSSCATARRRSFERGAWHLGKHYKWIDPLAILWIALICILFLLPLFPDGIPGKASGNHYFLDVNWIDVNYAPLTVGAAFLFFGGWWIVSAKNWFKGPVRMGSEEELERIEAGLASGD